MGIIRECIQTFSQQGTSDFHFHVNEVPYIRNLGEIRPLEEHPLISEQDMKDFMDELAVPENKRDELGSKGAFDFGVRMDEMRNLRCNFYYQRGQLALAVRILKGTIPDFEALHLPQAMKKILKEKSGLVLVTGLTGNGKSTTIASLIDMINRSERKHIITIEDPIEYRYTKSLSLVSQREVPTDCLSFAEGLRSALRQDPDIILIGEMRDKETIDVTLEAAESGHLVFSTLHTSSAAASVDRLISYYSADGQNAVRSKLANVLTAVFTQKLIPALDGKGMYAATELMFPNTALRAVIRDGKLFQITNFIKLGSREDMVTMDDCLAMMVRENMISYENALINTNDRSAFEAAFADTRFSLKIQR